MFADTEGLMQGKIKILYLWAPDGALIIGRVFGS